MHKVRREHNQYRNSRLALDHTNGHAEMQFPTVEALGNEAVIDEFLIEKEVDK